MRMQVLVLTIASLHLALAQQAPSVFGLPRVGDGANPKAPNALTDPVASYSSRHEAALAALQSGYKASTIEHNPTRAIRLLLVSLHREPYVPKTLYDMGILCAQAERWRDALSFYGAVQQANPDPALAKLAAAESERVAAIEHLQGTPEGKKQRQFDIRFLELMKKINDPIAALPDVKSLSKADGTRWEPLALAGLLHAEAGAFPASMKALEEAARLAPLTRRPKLQSAAEAARRESNFAEQVKSADELWEKQQYDSAAKLYAKAWEDSPGHLNVAMEAATGFLLGDQVPLAVQVLGNLRDSADNDLSAKAVAMLKELGAVSEDAKREATRERAAPAGQQSEDAANLIKKLIGQLTTPQMELAAAPNPPLVDDTTSIIPVPDEELTGGHNDGSIQSAESVFALYQRDAPAGSAPPLIETPQPASGVERAPAINPGPVAAIDHAPTAAGDRPTLPRIAAPNPLSERAATPPPPGDAAASVNEGPQVSISSNPTGAAVVFDDTNKLQCTAPCQIPLAVGRHTLRATFPGYREALRIFNVEKKPAPVEVTLAAKVGSLSVDNQAAGAAVFLNGRKTDSLTPARFSLTEGSYEVGVEVDGRMAVQKVTVKDGGILNIKF